jgi:hypothetical protein
MKFNESLRTVLLEDWKISLGFNSEGTLESNKFIKKNTVVYVTRYPGKDQFMIMADPEYHPINGFKLVVTGRESLEKLVKLEKNWFK